MQPVNHQRESFSNFADITIIPLTYVSRLSASKKLNFERTWNESSSENHQNLQLRFFKTNDAKPAMRNLQFPFISPPSCIKTTHPSIFPYIPLGVKIGKLQTQKSLLRTTTTTTGSRSPVARDSIQPSLAADNGSRKAASVANTCH